MREPDAEGAWVYAVSPPCAALAPCRSDDRGRRPNLAGERLRVTGRRTARARRERQRGHLEAGGGPDHKKAPRERPGRAASSGAKRRARAGGQIRARQTTNAIGAGLFPPQTNRPPSRPEGRHLRQPQDAIMGKTTHGVSPVRCAIREPSSGGANEQSQKSARSRI